MAEPSNISPPSTAASECGCEPGQQVATESSEPRTESRTPRTTLENQAEAARSKASEAGQRAKQTVRESAESAKAAAQEVTERAKRQMGEVTEKATQQGETFLNQQKSRIASELHAYSDAARRAASRLEDESDTNLARYVRSAADRMETFGRSLNDRSLGELVDQVEDMARRRPEVFFGAMFVAGLAAARFAKASRRRRMQDRIASAGTGQPPAESTYFETRPVAAPSPVYPSPAPAVIPPGSTLPAGPASSPINPISGVKYHG